MSLQIETFTNGKGPSALFKALGHPMAVLPTQKLMERLEGKEVALYDPLNQFNTFDALYSLSELNISQIYVQNIEEVGQEKSGKITQPIISIQNTKPDFLFVLAYDAQRLIDHIKHMVSPSIQIVSFDDIRLPTDFITNTRNYTDPLNFVTNFAFFQDDEDTYTRIFTANYWSGWGSEDVSVWCRLMDHKGEAICEWRDPIGQKGQTIVIDSRDIRKRFNLEAFQGQLYLHIIGAKGHDILKYALDIVSKKGNILTATHDANPYPADHYAGLPAPCADTNVVFWVQNSHPTPIKKGSIGFCVMGEENTMSYLQKEIPGFGTYALDLTEVLPQVKWPQQIEVHAGKHFVRPRYEVIDRNNLRRMAHANVERNDLKPDPKIAELSNLMGKSYILSAPILPFQEFTMQILPTPMARSQQHLPLAIHCYDSKGHPIAMKSLGNLPRNHQSLLNLDDLISDLPTSFGHLELVYDFNVGKEADGWIHGIFRYIHRKNDHAAETSFGSHIYNTVMTYKNEPQSYVGRAPGLSTRLFLRLGHDDLRTFCHLMYPISTPWHKTSQTDLILYNQKGEEVAIEKIQIPESGSCLWFYDELFSEALRSKAGPNAYIIIRDSTCRLFGYHGLMTKEGRFSLDHMFGF